MAKVLLVDDEEGIRRTTPVLLAEDGHEVRVAGNGKEAREALEAEDFDVVLTDIVMPDASGIDLLADARRLRPHASVILLTGQPSVETASEALRRGAHDYLPKPVRGETLRRVVRQAAERASLRQENARLHEARRRHIEELEGLVSERTRQLKDLLETERQRLGQTERMLDATVEAFSRAMEIRDPYTAGHQRRVTRLAMAIGRSLRWDDDCLRHLRIGSMLHDIGKLKVPSEILAKPSRLTTAEFALIREHPVSGWEVIAPLDFAGPVGLLVRQHHERLDGSGYPDGLRGDAILPESRVLGVADVVEAMASHRPYRPALGLDAALDEVRKGAGRLYDPEVVQAAEALLAAGFDFNGDAPGTAASPPPKEASASGTGPAATDQGPATTAS